ncbi:MAG TPA: GTPase Era [Terriglobales bacterium]|nr:GTPase Era [Terriglobales bacterium]
MALRSGYVCILGRPNAGKSTLLNALVGEKLAIVTNKPQTTRSRIQGFINIPGKKGGTAGQIILIDTPGVHRPDSSLGRKMMSEVREALETCDVIWLIVDATERFGTGDQAALNLAKKSGRPVLLLLNKIDVIHKDKLLPLIAEWNARFQFREIIPVSALRKDGLDRLLEASLQLLPPGPKYFPEDQITDQPLRFLAAEMIREQVLLATKEEVPYATTVLVDSFEEEPKLTRIAATIYTEREGQKGILIGKRGEMLKRIGTQARLALERLLGTKVFLELFVKVKPGWRESRHFIEDLDWRRQLEKLSGRATSEEEEPE